MGTSWGFLESRIDDGFDGVLRDGFGGFSRVTKIEENFEKDNRKDIGRRRSTHEFTVVLKLHDHSYGTKIDANL